MCIRELSLFPILTLPPRSPANDIRSQTPTSLNPPRAIVGRQAPNAAADGETLLCSTSRSMRHCYRAGYEKSGTASSRIGSPAILGAGPCEEGADVGGTSFAGTSTMQKEQGTPS
jgi:hypothetical protein